MLFWWNIALEICHSISLAAPGFLASRILAAVKPRASDPLWPLLANPDQLIEKVLVVMNAALVVTQRSVFVRFGITLV